MFTNILYKHASFVFAFFTLIYTLPLIPYWISFIDSLRGTTDTVYFYKNSTHKIVIAFFSFNLTHFLYLENYRYCAKESLTNAYKIIVFLTFT